MCLAACMSHLPCLQIPPTVASASEHPATPDIAGLPLTPPSISVFLWLSSHLVRWKFFARHLGLGEHDIDRIELDNPKDIQEQCYQMLRTFGQQQPQSCTYRRIGEALWESEKNRHLFFEYCTKVSEQ